jgi:hypothetical protein
MPDRSEFLAAHLAAVEPFFGERNRDFVDGLDVSGRDHGLLVHVAEERDLALDVRVEQPIGAAEQDVRLDANRPQVPHAVLRRLGLELAGRADEGHERQVNVQ